jgi:hypothetical protein
MDAVIMRLPGLEPAARRRRRRGVALVSALALLTLAAALLAGSFASSTSLVRAERSARAAVYAETLARHAAAEVFAAWVDDGDPIAVHAYSDREGQVSASFGRTVVRARIHRISASLYTITVDVRVGAGAVPIAHRRARLVVERSPPSDSVGAPGALRPIAQWSFAGIY